MPDQYLYSVGCLVRKENQVLLVRHTYGGAAGKLLIPGGFCNQNELPEEAAEREVLEETGFTAEPIRFAAMAEEIFTNPDMQARFPQYCWACAATAPTGTCCWN